MEADISKESPDDYGLDGKAIVKRVCAEIELYDQVFTSYYERCDGIMKRLKDERAISTGETKNPRFNMLWSNNNVVEPASYSQRPKPVVKRRFNSKDNIGRVAAEVWERSIEAQIDTDEFDEAMKAVNRDFTLLARGVPWVRYVPLFGQQELQVSDEAYSNEQPDEPTEQLLSEDVYVDYIHRKDFGHSVARKWCEVSAVWRHAYLTRDELIERFGAEKGKKVQLDYVPEEVKSRMSADDRQFEHFKKAKITEYWDKRTRKVYWVHKAFVDEPLDVRDDWLKLKNFFPCPRPAYGTLTNDSLVPIPDYAQVQDVSNTLDVMLARITDSADAIKTRGIYDSASVDLARLLKSGHNTMTGVKNMAALVERGGLDGLIKILPIDDQIRALSVLQNAFAFMKDIAYEVSGNPDIMRGATDPRETATAQRGKLRFVNGRLKTKQEEMARLAKETLSIVGEIIVEQFEPQTIMLMAGVPEMDPTEQQIVPQALELLKIDKMRGFRLDIETDSTIATDDEVDKAEVNELIQVVGQFLKNALPLVQEVPEFGEVAMEFLLMTARVHRAGRTVEDNLETAAQKVLQRGQQQAQQPEQPDPAIIKAQQDAQVQMAKLDLENKKLQAKLMEIQQDRDEADKTYAAKIAEVEGKMMQAQIEANTKLKTELMQSMAQAREGQANRELEAAKVAEETRRQAMTFAPSV